ncbi:hypothetical protein HY386_02280 [Candidatus Daviesbacteria bacterium]|nr:hypothetical protein [Candidatus Daviesbacteria bacterium]
MPELTYAALIIGLGIVAILTTIFNFRGFNKKIKSGEDEPFLNQEQQSYQTLHSAIKKAQAILSSAELSAIKVVSDSKFYKEQFEKDLEEKLQNEFTDYLSSLRTRLEKVAEELTNYLKYLRESADVSKNENQELIRTQIAQIFAKFEENLGDFLTQTEQHSVQSIELELKATRNLVETYKQQQLKIIDENIIAMLEKTLALVLSKKLSLKDQVDLIYESLEKAKAEKFII